MADDMNVSVIVIYSLVFIFIVFLFLQQGDFIAPTTGYVLFTTDSLKGLGELSLTTLIVLFVIVIALVVGGFFIYKKLKNKQKAISEIPIPPKPAEKSIASLGKEFNLPLNQGNIQKNEKGANVLDEDINKLFTLLGLEQNNLGTQKTSENIFSQTNKTEEPGFDLEELENLIRSLFEKKYTKESILKYLTTKGFKLAQIRKAVDLINEKNLRNYIKFTLSNGFAKQEIIRALLSNGWDKESILKYLG